MSDKKFKRWKIWGGVILLFLFGVITGSLTTALLMKYHYSNILREGPPPVNRMMTRYMTRNLDLSDQQRKEIRTIAGKYGSEMLKISSQARNSIRELAERQAEEIKEVLNPDQQARFEENIRNLRERIERRRGHREDFRMGHPPRHSRPGSDFPPPGQHTDSLQ